MNQYSITIFLNIFSCSYRDNDRSQCWIIFSKINLITNMNNNRDNVNLSNILEGGCKENVTRAFVNNSIVSVLYSNK